MMEIRPIDGNALLTVPNVNWVYQYDETGEYIKYKAIPVEAIEKAPTLDLAPVVHGEWIKQKNGRLICSVCGVRGLQDSDELDYYYCPSVYCPNCGAKMDGGKKDD